MGKARKRIMAVGFDPSAMEQLGEYCKDFELIQVGCMRQLNQVMSKEVSETVDLIAVSTVDTDTSTHLEEIDSFRSAIPTPEIPIISAISRYQMDLGKELEQLSASAWVFQPLNRGELRATLEELNI